MFYYQTTDLDFGETSIENIFINEFMPMADGTAVKVYLLAFKHAADGIKCSNKKLAKHLNLALDDILRSWDFWETKGIIVKIQKEEDYDVQFLSLRQLVARGLYQNQKSVTQTKSKINIIEANKDPDIRKMFYAIDQLMRRQLVPHERNIILDWLYEKNISKEIILRAFKYAIEKRNISNLKYVQSIVISWHDQGILSEEDLDSHFSKMDSHYNHYKHIYHLLGYGSKMPSAGDKEVMDRWLDEFELEMDFLTVVLKDASTRTNNINMNYMNKVVISLVDKGVKTIPDYEKHIENRKSTPKKSTATKNNKFHNFKQRDKKYTNEELEKKLGIRK